MARDNTHLNLCVLLFLGLRIIRYEDISPVGKKKKTISDPFIACTENSCLYENYCSDFITMYNRHKIDNGMVK